MKKPYYWTKTLDFQKLAVFRFFSGNEPRAKFSKNRKGGPFGKKSRENQIFPTAEVGKPKFDIFPNREKTPREKETLGGGREKNRFLLVFPRENFCLWPENFFFADQGLPAPPNFFFTTRATPTQGFFPAPLSTFRFVF